MPLAISDLLGERGYIRETDFAVVLFPHDFVDSNGHPFLTGSIHTGLHGAEKFLAAYFAYLNYRCTQRPATVEVETGAIDVDLLDGVAVPDNNQAVVSRPQILAEGVQFETRNGEVQIRTDFNFSIYTENRFVYDAADVV